MLQHYREIIDFIKTLKAVTLTVKQESLRSPVWNFPGGKASFDQVGHVEVKLIVERQPKWKLAKEHLETNPIWELVDTWKMLEEEELGLRRKLLQAVYDEVERRTKLPLSFGDGYEEEFILGSFPYRIYYRTFGNLTGDVHEPILTLRIDGTNCMNRELLSPVVMIRIP
jgi:hypothetical protein